MTPGFFVARAVGDIVDWRERHGLPHSIETLAATIFGVVV